MKKPFTVFVAVVIILILGFVSLRGLKTDLLPELSLPYMIVITPYPGAGPERVESQVAEPLEAALGTVSNVKNVFSVCADSYCITQLEFEDGIDMDSTMVKVSGAVNNVASSLPEEAGTSSILELSLDMIATMYVAVSRDDYDIYELSGFVDREVVPYLERQEGVASVSAIGLVEKSVQVDLDAEKIAEVNKRILNDTQEALDEAGEQLEDALAEVEKGQQQLQAQERSFGQTVSGGIFSVVNPPVDASLEQMEQGILNVLDMLDEIEANLDELTSEETREEVRRRINEIREQYRTALEEIRGQAQAGDFSFLMQMATDLRLANERFRALLDRIRQDAEQRYEEGPGYHEVLERGRNAMDALSARLDQVPEVMKALEDGFAAMTQGQLDAAVLFSQAGTQLATMQQTLVSAQAQYDSAREQAIQSANIDSLVNPQTLSQLIYAQNFSMPAGYIDDANDRSFMLKVGEEYQSSGEIADTVLVDSEMTGRIRLKDVANITVIDNADLTYTNLDGERGVLLSVYKSSASGTNEVARNCREALEQFEQDNDGAHAVILVDQGSYIDIIISDILQSMIFGALLAILVLALFLRDVRPTIMVAISIPLSVMFTLVLMYFSDISLNIMTMSGLALGIGMLVDNSIVVMENIIRLRQRGVSPGNASVQGTRQVAGAIIASTLTTICVFVPMAFANGSVRSLLIPMALSITYCLTASLVTAMTVIPASASVLMRRTKKPKKTVFDRMQDGYERSLRFCLRHKLPVLLLTVALLVFSIFELVRMGVVLVPEVASEEIQVNIRMDEELERSERYDAADALMERMLRVEGIAHIGIMDGGSSAGLLGAGGAAFGGGGGGGGGGRAYICYVKAESGLGASEIRRIIRELDETGEGLPLTVRASNNSMGDVSALTSAGLSLNVYGMEEETLLAAARQVADAIEEIEGFTNVDDGSSEREPALQLTIDREKAMSYGLTVAQIYAQIAQRMATSATSTTIEEGYITMRVTVYNETDPLTVENLMDMEFEETSLSAAASQAGLGGIMGGGGSGAAFGGGTGGFRMDALGDLGALTGGAEEEDGEGEEEEAGEEKSTVHKLSEFATLEEVTSPDTINRKNLVRYITVSAQTQTGYNTTLLSRELSEKLAEINANLPNGYRVEIDGEVLQIQDMLEQMSQLMLVAFLFIYLVMVAQFQSFLSPFIILFTVPLAFTGGMLGLLLFGEQLSVLSLMGFLVLMGTVVNNGIVFVDYTNQMRIGGLKRRDALVATGRTRMRPILMTALTTILAMGMMVFGSGMGAQMGRGMAIVIAGGLLYATLMTLYIVPVMYDLLFRKQPLHVLVDDDLDELPDDAAEYLASHGGEDAVEFMEEFQKDKEQSP
ncbi:MAG: efflux RND transporter permease subunit [Lachnospiraceae bacterium]|nr:efflux RND transporter permease subunit [Lachnospiraceae bacterium]